MATKRGDRDTADRALSVLAHLEDRCGLAIENDPPKPMTSSDWSAQPSRWGGVQHTAPAPGKGQQEARSRVAPKGLDVQSLGGPAGPDWAYLDALAVHMITPVRPAEFVPGWRNGRDVPEFACRPGWARCSSIAVAPVKSHNGKYGTGQTTIKVRADSPNPAVRHLVQRCRTSRNRAIAVALKNTNAMRKALGRLRGSSALGPDAPKVTGYLYRNQVIADYKATLGAGGAVAGAAGHCTDRTELALWAGRARTASRGTGSLRQSIGRRGSETSIAHGSYVQQPVEVMMPLAAAHRSSSICPLHVVLHEGLGESNVEPPGRRRVISSDAQRQIRTAGAA